MLELQTNSDRQWIWLGDFLHLVMLLVLTWAALYIAFRLNEEKWPKLLGLG